jgi:hypothetical protein
VVKITADKKRNRAARELTWTTERPPPSKRGPENIMTKPEKISDEAADALTEGDLWSLFFTEPLMDKIVEATNQKIGEEMTEQGYSRERMAKSPYICETDKVCCLFIFISPNIPTIMIITKILEIIFILTKRLSRDLNN